MRNLTNSLNYIQDRDTKKTIKDILYKAAIYLKSSKSFNTDFLTPTEFKYACELLKNMDIDFSIVEPGADTERKVIIVGDEKDAVKVFILNPFIRLLNIEMYWELC